MSFLRIQSADSYQNYTNNYAQNSTNQLSSLRSKDVNQAIGDMQKDSMLQPYQYYVGEAFSASQIKYASEDGVVVKKPNMDA
ncbi:MAG: hypothetical protein K6G23_00920 [Lachnospiraceae bacterium]|nr:hypothetical protein [Lachnospiraceae bacterium]